MNTRIAANDELAPDEPTDPSIDTSNTSETSDEDVQAQAAINEALVDAAKKGMRIDVKSLHVERTGIGEISLADVMLFLRKKFPAFVLFVRMGDDDFKNPDGTWKEGCEPSGDLDGPNPPPKREWGIFFEGPDTPYDPKARRVMMKWLDANSVRDFSKDRMRS